MYTSTSITRCHVNDEVANLTIKVVLVSVPVSTRSIRVRINDRDTRKTGCRFDCGESDRIADKLSVIVLDERRADEICTGRKVDESRGYGTGVAALTAAVTVGDGGIDRCCIIGITVPGRAIVPDVAEYFVRRLAKCGDTLTLDVGKPIRR